MEILRGLFEATGLYSTSGGLGEHLRGLDVDCQTMSRQSVYSIVFLFMIFVNAVIMLNYYYGLLNRYPFNKFGWWLMNVFTGAFIIYLIAYLEPHRDLVNKNYCEQLSFHNDDCMGFGLTAAIYSVTWSVLLSLLIKWKSIVNKKIPF
jgi:magnesium-transporting ATPase (P-type)